MSRAIVGEMHKQRLLVVLLTWYKNLVFLGNGSVEFSTIAVMSLLARLSLSPVDGPAGLSELVKVALDEALVELLSRGTM